MASPNWMRRLKMDRRLLMLIGLAAAVVAVEFGIRGWEAHQQIEAELKKVRGRAAVLAINSDAADWTARTLQAEAERKALQARLWLSPSEAQAQARLRDWLNVALRTAGAPRPSVSLLAPQSSPSAAASAPTTAAPSSVAPVASAGNLTALPALRVRASINFDLAPGVVENALAQIEGGGQLARVDSLSVAVRSRRVEMVVSVPVLLMAEGR